MVTLFAHQEEALARTAGCNKVAVKGFENLYEVDTFGNVYSLRNNCILKPYPNANGYMRVNLYDLCGRCVKKYVHRIVAEAFLDNSENKPNVNHIDCDVRNNDVRNLMWCTQMENINYQVKMGRHNKAQSVVVDGVRYESERQASISIYGNTWKFSYLRRKGMI